MTDRELALAHVSQLEKGELLAFFQEATRHRGGAWFIGVAEYNPKGEGLIGPPPNGWDIRILAPHDPSAYDGPWDLTAPFARQTFCSTCDMGLLGYAKQIQCPICGSKESAV